MLLLLLPPSFLLPLQLPFLLPLSLLLQLLPLPLDRNHSAPLPRAGRKCSVGWCVPCEIKKAGSTSSRGNTSKVSKQWKTGWGTQRDSGAGAEVNGVVSAVQWRRCRGCRGHGLGRRWLGGVGLGVGTVVPMQRYMVSKEQCLRCRGGEGQAETEGVEDTGDARCRKAQG